MTPECNCLEGLLDAIRKGRTPGSPVVRDNLWEKDDVRYVEDRVAAILERREATQQDEDEDLALAPVVFDVPRVGSL